MMADMGTCHETILLRTILEAHSTWPSGYISKRMPPIFIEPKLYITVLDEFTSTRLPEYLTRLDLHRRLCCDP